MHYLDIVHLDHQFDCLRGRDEWVSVWNNKNEYDNDEKVNCLS